MSQNTTAGRLLELLHAESQAIRDAVAFYPAAMDACHVDDEQVTAQPGGFYGGWITSDVEL